jgi:DNA-binding NarL/FixJ family response regulator
VTGWRSITAISATPADTTAPGSPKASSVCAKCLTPTEREVAQLVAEGLSNPGIADRLFISRATVKTHLTHVFTKLDITNRAQLTALVTRAIAESTRGRG